MLIIMLWFNDVISCVLLPVYKYLCLMHFYSWSVQTKKIIKLVGIYVDTTTHVNFDLE